MNQSTLYPKSSTKGVILPLGVIIAIFVGWLTSVVGFVLPVLLLALSLAVPFVLVVFNKPKIGLITYIVYSFLLFFFIREVGNLPFSYVFELILFLTWLAAIFHNTEQYDWSIMKNDLCLLGAFWFIINILELANPVAGSIVGWIADARHQLQWVLIVPLSMVIFNKNKDLNLFLVIIIGMSLVAAFNGFKQEFIGLFPGEQEFVNGPASHTHILYGKLRAFSFYSDAGQFGASMAHLCVVALVLALGPFKTKTRIACAAAAAAFLLAMFMSGTRGSFYALIGGLLVVLFVNKNIKVISVVFLIGILSFSFLKFTTIGNGSYEIRRMRSAVNMEDASFNLRLINQAKLADYLKDHPFGGGVGSIGFAGKTYNKGTYLATIPPDSYWVKVWASYGVVGLTIWFSMMMYIIGKACGIIWNIKNKQLKYKLTALAAGVTGIFLCSYGNEVMNNMPSSMLLYFSLAFVFLGPRLDSEAEKHESYA